MVNWSIMRKLGDIPARHTMTSHVELCTALAMLSGRDVEFVKRELVEFSGTFKELKGFYLFHRYFPSEVAG